MSRSKGCQTMPIEFQCAACGEMIRAPDAAAGKSGRCPGCKEAVSVPVRRATAPPGTSPNAQAAPAAVATGKKIRFACPRCRKTINTPPQMAGKKGKCPHCQTVVAIPRAGKAPATGEKTTTGGDGHMHLACPGCRSAIKVPESYAGKVGKCPKCGRQVRIPVPARRQRSTPTPEEALGLSPLGDEPSVATGGLDPLGDDFGLSPLDDEGGLSPLGDDDLGLPSSDPLGDLAAAELSAPVSAGAKTLSTGSTRTAAPKARVKGRKGAQDPWDLKWLLFSAEGRIPRRVWWAVTLATAGVTFVFSFLLGMLADTLGVAILPILGLIMLANVWIKIVVTIKRWHDRGKPGVWVLIVLIPCGIGAVWELVECGCLRGTVGPNEFGPDPT